MLDVVIIGGGVVGCATAREISRYDLKTVLLEKTADICNGQSKANTAIIHGGYDAKPGTLKAKYNMLGNVMFDKICTELDVPYEWNTSLVVSLHPEDDEMIETLLEQGKTNGCPGVRIIEHDELLQLEPNLNPNVCKALLVPTGGIVCPYELTQAFAENAASNGVEFVRNAKVTNVEKIEGGWRVTSSAGVYEAKAVVNCAGLYSDEINNMVSERKLEIQPRRGEYYIVDKKYKDYFHATIFPCPSKMGKGILVARTIDGTVLLGPTAEDIDDKADTRTTAFGQAKALDGAHKYWEKIPTRDFITNFSGLRAHCVTTNDFVIGEPDDAPMFFNAAGIESPGLTSSPAIAEHLATEIASKLDARENASFNPIRKGIPKFREMTKEERAEAIKANPDFAKIVCRCETVTEAEIREAIRRPVGARTVDGIKRRTRAGMGRCQAGFCTPRVVEILCEELGLDPTEVTKFGGDSRLIEGHLFKEAE
ncbi:MAG: NAD(P)/FAD-dependent oxidoreductase [Oscillospiraceae bacterium]|nr:NAD(P)/FAD-dependent oxidoreductase [Oscillospiraceae bacterium]